MPSDMFGRDLEEDIGWDLDLLKEEDEGYIEEDDQETDD